MDTKARNAIVRSQDEVIRWKGGIYGAPIHWTVRTDPINTCFDSIEGYRGPRDLSSVHACTHSRCTIRPWPARYHKGPNVDKNLWADGTVFTCPSSYSVSPPTMDLGSLDAAMADLRGEIPTDVLLPNFVMELPEALTMHKQLMENVFSHSPSSWKDAGVRYATSLGKRVANTHLLYQFGIVPLAKDIVSLAHLVGRVSARVRHLSSLSTESWTSWRRSVKVPDNSLHPYWEQSPYIAYPQRTEDITTADMQLFARIKRSRTINSATSVALGALDAAGITQVGSVIWEAIPFSFVADWFYPCGRALNTLNVQAFTGCLANQMVGSQWHLSCVSRFYGCVACNGDSAAASDEINFAEATVRFYQRTGGFPSTQTAANYGLRQVLLSGSLALQRA